jgi:hypothetical protein
MMPSQASYPVAEEFVANLVHAMRQPLSTIDTCLYLIEVLLPPGERKAREQLSEITRQLCCIDEILSSAAQTREPSRVLTNAAMAAVT